MGSIVATSSSLVAVAPEEPNSVVAVVAVVCSTARFR
jgi:hypothetical protein